MSDRIHSFAVILTDDIGEERAELIRSAILQLNGVLSAEPNVTDFESFMAQERARSDMFNRLLAVLQDWNKP